MPQPSTLSRFLLLPELKLIKSSQDGEGHHVQKAYKESEFEVCPKCASPSRSVYDHRWVRAHDAPIRGSDVWLSIKKRRFYCKTCRKPFTEPIQGIRKGKRTTERYRRNLLWA